MMTNPDMYAIKLRQIAELKAEAEFMRQQFLAGSAPLTGEKYVIDITERSRRRCDLKAAEQLLAPEVFAELITTSASTVVTCREIAQGAGSDGRTKPPGDALEPLVAALSKLADLGYPKVTARELYGVVHGQTAEASPQAVNQLAQLIPDAGLEFPAKKGIYLAVFVQGRIYIGIPADRIMSCHPG